MVITADLHLHSCLSPCASLEMSPRVIARRLKEKGVTLGALTDHNSALNCPAFKTACLREGVVPLFGLEAQSSEEVHILCLFPRLETALAFGDEVYASLLRVRNVPARLGDQVIVNDRDEITGEVENYLVVASAYDVYALARRTRALGGLAIPAHADRPAFSLMSQLGTIPDGPWDAVEMTGSPPWGPSFPPRPVTRSSDAHYPEHIARRVTVLDTGDGPLTTPQGEADLAVIRRALERLRGA
ncbi:MAG: PHP domain-containing protein [Spirochaetaceae bacterium]|jgi:PHP family Zn ribbon phosphoesterase|nr:PHP domain-containing protein [Spirochaetaceae bacterium]